MDRTTANAGPALPPLPRQCTTGMSCSPRPPSADPAPGWMRTSARVMPLSCAKRPRLGAVHAW
jgi:hypothetical protein